ncbi:MAG: energy transducer TonB [Ferruginibacter sp.]
MKTTLFPLCCFCMFFTNVAKAQNYKFMYYLNAKLTSTSKDEAIIIGKGMKEDGVFRLDCYSIADAKLYLVAHFTDSSLSITQGPYTSYYENRKIESQAVYEHGLLEGLMQKWDTLGRKTDSIIYLHDNVIKAMEFSYHSNGKLASYKITDSLKNTLHNLTYNENDSLISEVFFNGQRGVKKTYTKTGITYDSLFTREEKKAEFAGGPLGWLNYLKANLNASVPVANNAPEGIYTVIIKFIVKKDGDISDIESETHFGYGMEQEAIRIISRSPKWVPAIQYGRNVNAYRRQPITFTVSEN